MQRLANPLPIYLDARGALLDGGSIYVGTANGDPELSPIQLYWNSALTIPASQPVRTLGGQIVNGATPSPVFMAAADYSIRIRDSNNAVVSYVASAVDSAGPVIAYQPLDDDLTAIAANGTTPYGRDLLNLTNQAGLKAATGIVAGLPTTGGAVTGNITRSGAGAHLYHSATGMTSGRVFLAPASGADPTSLPGDIWLKT